MSTQLSPLGLVQGADESNYLVINTDVVKITGEQLNQAYGELQTINTDVVRLSEYDITLLANGAVSQTITTDVVKVKEFASDEYGIGTDLSPLVMVTTDYRVNPISPDLSNRLRINTDVVKIKEYKIADGFIAKYPMKMSVGVSFGFSHFTTFDVAQTISTDIVKINESTIPLLVNESINHVITTDVVKITETKIPLNGTIIQEFVMNSDVVKIRETNLGQIAYAILAQEIQTDVVKIKEPKLNQDAAEIWQPIGETEGVWTQI